MVNFVGCYCVWLTRGSLADSLFFWKIVSGAEYCHIVDGGRCVSDGAWSYANNEECEIKALRPLLATATEFATEENYDYFTVAGKEYHGSEGPQGLPVDSGAEVVWRSDSSNVAPGFMVCASETSSLVTVAPQSYKLFCTFIGGATHVCCWVRAEVLDCA